MFAPEEEGQFQPGRCSRWWLHNSLQALEKDLAALGSRLTFRRSPESRLALVQVGLPAALHAFMRMLGSPGIFTRQGSSGICLLLHEGRPLAQPPLHGTRFQLPVKCKGKL